MNTRDKLLILLIILIIGITLFFVIYFKLKTNDSYIKKHRNNLCNKDLLDKKILESETESSSDMIIYMSADNLDIIPSQLLEELRNRYSDSIEIHGNQSCEDFIYEYYGPYFTHIYKNMDVRSSQLFWGYCILYVKGGCYCSIQTDIDSFPLLSNDVTEWYQSTDGSVTISNRFNPALWKLITVSAFKMKRVYGKKIKGLSPKPKPISNFKSDKWELLMKTYNAADMLISLHEGMSPVDKDKIDLPILYINMDISTDRLSFIEKQTHGLSKPVIRIPGVIVSDKTFELYNRGTRRGAVGCFLAHRNAMKELLKKGWDKALILEDDACLLLSSRWLKKLSELKAPAWLSQGTTAYIITSSVARDFLKRTEGILDIGEGVDNLFMIAYGNNPMNIWSDYPKDNWNNYPYVYPAAHIFKTNIQGFTKEGYLSDCNRAVKIINLLGAGTKKILLSRKEIHRELGSHVTRIVSNTPVSRSQLIKLELNRDSLLEVYAPAFDLVNQKDIKNMKLFEIVPKNLVQDNITTWVYTADNPLPKASFHFVVVCTPNYYNIGKYGISMLSKYCKKHGYTLSIEQNAIKGLHANFTKNSAAVSTLKNSTADYIINIDADIAVKDFDIGVEDIMIIDSDAIMQAPEDYWTIEKRNNIINAGAIIWKNCTRAIEINELWLSKARGECYFMARYEHPRQQNTFDNCVLPDLKNGELVFLDHKLIGLPHSSIIAQIDGEEETKIMKIRKFWVKAGSPTLEIDKDLDNVISKSDSKITFQH